MKAIFTNRKTKLAVTTLLIVVITAFFTAFKDNNFEIAKNLDIYYTLFRELNLYYVDETDPGDLIKTSIDKMLENLDPHSVYIPAKDLQHVNEPLKGNFDDALELVRGITDKYPITLVNSINPFRIDSSTILRICAKQSSLMIRKTKQQSKHF